ncbi:MAG: hypothetical protein LBV16_09335 [Elusimicrobiota bacterium]|jgi:hypothetical protein|nr:hypothetical protein [Elusimicrobiota bacterium]
MSKKQAQPNQQSDKGGVDLLSKAKEAVNQALGGAKEAVSQATAPSSDDNTNSVPKEQKKASAPINNRRLAKFKNKGE